MGKRWQKKGYFGNMMEKTNNFKRQTMKTGLVITTYNRPEYATQCFNSLAEMPDGVDCLAIIDDCSIGEMVSLLWQMRIEYTTDHFYLHRFEENKGIHNALLHGFDYLISKDCDVLINLDPDAIVKPDFIIRLIDMLSKHPDKIITGFNTTTGGRHKPVSYFDGGVYKRTIGGINMCMTAETYRDIVRPNLTAKNWDWLVCEEMQRRNKYFVALTPSCVQHIGLVSSMGHYDGGVDVADDF